MRPETPQGSRIGADIVLIVGHGDAAAAHAVEEFDFGYSREAGGLPNGEPRIKEEANGEVEEHLFAGAAGLAGDGVGDGKLHEEI